MAMRPLIAVLLCLALVCSPVAGQGNRRSAAVLGSTNVVFARLQKLYSRSERWKQAFKGSSTRLLSCSTSTKSSSSKSSSRPANLCAGSPDDSWEEAQQRSTLLTLATSPRAYSSTDTQQTGGLQLVSPPSNQAPCQTCTAFAVAAAAEAAMATALGVDVSQCSISAKALHYCGNPAISRTCNSGWNLQEALTELKQRGSSLPTAVCLSDGLREEDAESSTDLCDRSDSCRAPNPLARQGSFSAQRVSTPWEAQRHIRQHGAVVTHFELYADFDAFFRNASNAKAVYRPPPGAEPQENHAVLLVGYDNDNHFWLARNSWGVDWGDGGLFRVAFDTCAVLTEAYGVIWTPNVVPDAVKLPVAPAAPQQPGCYWYKARPGDWLSRVARLAGIPLEQFMLDNTAAVQDLDAPITGLQLLLCKPNPDMIIDATKPMDEQLQSLLKIKAFIDTAGVLTEWSKESGADGGYCKWRGIDCTSGSKVVERINLWTGTGVSGLQGVLPPASAFDGLPGLRRLTIASQPGILGTLPSDWSRLQQLQDIRVANDSLAGTLPPSWAELTQLQALYLNDNKLRGPLPDSFKALTTLAELKLQNNSLNSSLPPSWSKMRALKVLALHNNTLRGPLPDSWSSMAALEDLGLYGNALTGSLPPSWGQLSRLRFFTAFKNKLQGPLPESFKDLEALTMLELSGNALTNSLPPSWGQLPNLKELALWGNKLRGTLPDTFKSLTKLEMLALSMNDLSGVVPPSWQSMASLKRLELYDNPQLLGCLPTNWKQQVSELDWQQRVFTRTNITGFC